MLFMTILFMTKCVLYSFTHNIATVPCKAKLRKGWQYYHTTTSCFKQYSIEVNERVVAPHWVTLASDFPWPAHIHNSVWILLTIMRECRVARADSAATSLLVTAVISRHSVTGDNIEILWQYATGSDSHFSQKQRWKIYENVFLQMRL